MQASSTPELPPRQKKKKSWLWSREGSRVGMSRVAPPSHRQEKSARKECVQKSTRKFLLAFIPFTPRPVYQGAGRMALLLHENPAFCLQITYVKKEQLL